MLMAQNLLLMRRRYRTFVSDAALFLATHGPYGMVLDFADASIAIKEASGVLNYDSKGAISEAGDIIGPLSKMALGAPSLKVTEQADGYSYFQAHNLFQQSEAHGSTPWVTTNSSGVALAPTRTNNYTAGPNGGQATRIQFDLNGGTTAGDISGVLQNVTTVTGASYSRDIWVRSTDGTSSYVMQITSASGIGTDITVTGSWQKFTAIGVAPVTSVGFQIRLRGGSGNSNTADVLVSGDHLRRTPSVSTYMKTTSAPAYDLPWVYRNGVKVGIYSGEAAATNGTRHNRDISNAHWIKRGTVSATKTATGIDGVANSATAITGLGTSGVNDFYDSFFSAGGQYTASAALAASFYIKKVSTTGVLGVFSATNSLGWSVDLSLVGSGWQRITPTHPAVTIGTPFVASGAGQFGLQFCAVSGGPLSFDIDCIQVEVGTRTSTPIITYGVAGFRGADSLSGLISAIPFDVNNQTWFAEVEVAPGFVSATADRIIGGDVAWTAMYAQSSTSLGVYLSNAIPAKAVTSIAGRNIKVVSKFSSTTGAKITADGLIPAANADTVPRAVTAFFVGSRAGTNDFLPGIYKKLGYFNRVISDAEMQAVSA